MTTLGCDTLMLHSAAQRKGGKGGPSDRQKGNFIHVCRLGTRAQLTPRRGGIGAGTGTMAFSKEST